jgi:hypothetical protein
VVGGLAESTFWSDEPRALCLSSGVPRIERVDIEFPEPMSTIAPATMTSDGKKRPTQPVLCATGISPDRQMPHNSCERTMRLGDLCARRGKRTSKESSAPYLNIVQHLESSRLWPLCFSDALRMRGNLRATPASGRRSWRGSRKVRAKMGASVGLAMTDQVNEKPTAGGKSRIGAGARDRRGGDLRRP